MQSLVCDASATPHLILPPLPAAASCWAANLQALPTTARPRLHHPRPTPPPSQRPRRHPPRRCPCPCRGPLLLSALVSPSSPLPLSLLLFSFYSTLSRPDLQTGTTDLSHQPLSVEITVGRHQSISVLAKNQVRVKRAKRRLVFGDGLIDSAPGEMRVMLLRLRLMISSMLDATLLLV